MAEKKSKKTAGGKKQAEAKKPTEASALPPIDTSSAAAAAAKLVASGSSVSHVGGESHDSAAFKKLKQSLAKPASSGVSNLLQSTAPARKSPLPFAGPKQVRHNQTFGADVNRSGVPRRTGG